MNNTKLLIENIFGKRNLKFFLVLGFASLCVYNSHFIISTYHFILKEYPYSIYAIVLLIFVFTLVKISHYKSNIKIKEDLNTFPKFLNITTESFMEICFMLNVDKKGSSKLKIINNNEDIAIDKAKGKVTLFTDGVDTYSCKVFEKTFEIENLSSLTEQNILDIPLCLWSKTEIWFEVELNGLFLSNQRCYSNSKFESKHHLLNIITHVFSHLDLYDFKVLCFKTNYNLVWIKQYIRKLKSYIGYFTSPQIYVLGNPTEDVKKLLRWDFLRRNSIKIILLLLIARILLFSIHSFWQFFQLFFVFLQWLGSYLDNLYK